MAQPRAATIPWRRNLFIAALATFASLGGLLAFTWGPESWRLLGSLNAQIVATALALMAATWAVNGTRAWLLARSLRYRVPWRACVRAALVGGLVSGLTPFMGGGGPAEALVLSRSGLPYAKALAAVTSSGVLGQAVLVIVSIGLAFSSVPLPGVPVVRALLRWILVIYALGLAGVAAALLRLHALAGTTEWLLGRLERVMPKAAGRLRAARRKSQHFMTATAEGIRTVLQGRPLLTLLVTLAYLVYYSLIFLVAPMLARGLGGYIPAPVLVGVQFPMLLLTGILPTPGASGGIEAAMAAVAAPHLPRAAVGIFVSSWRLLTFYTSLLAGAVAAIMSFAPERRQGDARAKPEKRRAPRLA